MSALEGISKIWKSKLGGATLIYTISTFFNSATPFLLLPLLTRYLSTDEYGVVSMFNATVSMLTPFITMGATTAIQRKIVEKDAATKEYVFNCLAVVIVSACIVSLLVFFGCDSIVEWTGIPSVYLFDLMLLAISTVLVDIASIILQMNSRTKTYAVFQNCGTLLNLAISFITIIGFGMGLRGRIYGLTYSKLVFAVIALFIIKREVGITPKPNKGHAKDIVFNFGLPMIPTLLKGTILTYTDRIFITNMVSISDTGIYSVGNQFSLPILLLEQAFNLAFVPWLYRKLEEGKGGDKYKIVKMTYLYDVAVLALAVVWSAISGPIIQVISGEDYYGASQYVFWLSLGYALTGMHMMVVNYIYYYKRVRLYSIVTIAVILSNCVLNYIFINLFGTVGAAIATMIANLLSLVFTWILVMRICDMPWNLRKRQKPEME